jgi:hypothetical protein
MVRNENQSFWKQHGMFISLLFIGLIFRFSFMYHQGLSNDELSGWVRTQFSDWNSFWHFGVKAGDMHPVFYQAFLWVWVRIFGDSEWALRSTSIFFYLLNSWMIYQICRRFFSKQIGLAVVALYVGLTFTIIHTVFARPYNSGTFFLLLAVWSIFEIERREKSFSFWFVGLSIGFLGAMLSHYYAFITASIIGLCALFYVSKPNIKVILICGIASILAFLPHWPITAFQLNQGGLRWLSPPKWNWLFDFGYQFFNFSWILFAFFVGIIVYSFLKAEHFKSKEERFVLRVFLLTYLLGHLISVFYTPVLRELVMLYSLPFLFIYLFRGFHFYSGKAFNWALLIFPILIGLQSIFVSKLLEPKNFGVFREIGQSVNQSDQKLGRENMDFASNFNSITYLNYYCNIPIKEPIIDWTNPEVVYQLADRAKNSSKDYFVYNWSNNFHLPMYYEVLRNHFPYVYKHQVFFNSAVTILSKKKTVFKSMQKHKLTTKFENIFQSGVVSNEEFIGAIIIPAKTLKDCSSTEYFTVEAKGKLSNASPLFLVVTLERDGEMLMSGENAVLYAAYDQARLLDTAKNVKFFNAFSLPENVLDTDVIHIYFWNPEKKKVEINRPKVFQVTIN